jgi:hypothetical protein
MSKTTTRDTTVAKLINEAGKAGQTMLNKCKESAKLAAAQLDAKVPMAARIDAVMSLYKVDFEAAGHNVRALFKDALTLHAAAQCPVSIEVIGKDGKKAEAQITAEEAIDLPKHGMREAAKQVREVHGMARKAGGGRTPKQTTKPVPEQVTSVKTDSDKFSEWLDSFDEYITDSVFHQRIVAHLIEIGYSLNKAAKGRKVTGKDTV